MGVLTVAAAKRYAARLAFAAAEDESDPELDGRGVCVDACRRETWREVLRVD